MRFSGRASARPSRRSAVVFALGLTCATGCATPVGAEEPAPPLIEAEGVRLQVGADVDARATRVSAESPDALVAVGVQVEAMGAAPLKVTAEVTEWDMRSRRAVFSGDVQAQRGPFRLRCETLTLEHGADAQVERALAEGAVQVRRDPWSARSSRATLEMATGLLVLEGEPSVDDGQSVLAGERIELYLDDERMRCEGCSLVVPDPLDPAAGPR